jgi:hypothetical protein
MWRWCFSLQNVTALSFSGRNSSRSVSALGDRISNSFPVILRYFCIPESCFDDKVLNWGQVVLQTRKATRKTSWNPRNEVLVLFRRYEWTTKKSEVDAFCEMIGVSDQKIMSKLRSEMSALVVISTVLPTFVSFLMVFFFVVFVFIVFGSVAFVMMGGACLVSFASC